MSQQRVFEAVAKRYKVNFLVYEPINKKYSNGCGIKNEKIRKSY
jgi:hypothetical protein